MSPSSRYFRIGVIKITGGGGEALDSGCADAIEKFIADWNGRADAGRWKHAAQADDNVWDNELK